MLKHAKVMDKRYFILACACLALMACTDEERPSSLPPEVAVDEARLITRTSALLQGQVTANGQGAVSQVCFRLGTSASMDSVRTCPPDSLQPAWALTGLQPGTTYFYTLEAGNGYDRVTATPRQFTTLPNVVPTVGALRVLGQGPVSLLAEFALEQDGGTPITSAGCRYWPTAGGGDTLTVQPAQSSFGQGDVLRVHLGGLQMHTAYTVQPYADNDVGTAYGQSYNFRTGLAVYWDEPGMLASLMESDDERYAYTDLSFVGPLNGTDLRTLRDMAGADLYDQPTPGRLAHIDLTDARIVAGGLSYNETNFSRADTVGYGLFSGCVQLQEVQLPASTRVIEAGAFAGCSGLTSLTLPASVRQVGASAGCSSLSAIGVSAANTVYASVDGVLYDYGQTRMVWYPQGKTDDELTLPETLTTLDDYALQGIHIRRLRLPDGVTSLGTGVFAGAALEEAHLGQGLRAVPTATFQDCSQLSVVRLGASTEWIGSYSFDGCPLRHLYVESVDPPVCADAAFAGLDRVLQTCVVHVPAVSLERYRASASWSQFAVLVGEE